MIVPVRRERDVVACPLRDAFVDASQLQILSEVRDCIWDFLVEAEVSEVGDRPITFVTRRLANVKGVVAFSVGDQEGNEVAKVEVADRSRSRVVRGGQDLQDALGCP